MSIVTGRTNPARLFAAIAWIIAIFLVYVLLPGNRTLAQGAGNWRVLTEATGMPVGTVQALAEAPSDLFGVPGLWIGGNQGLAYFNGREWVTFTTANSDLPSNNVLSLLALDQGTLFIGTDAGLARLDHRGTLHRGEVDRGDDGWTRYTAADSALPDNRVQALALHPDGWLLAGGATGAGALSLASPPRSDSAVQPPLAASTPDVRAIRVDDSRAIWLATAGGLAVYRGGGVTTYTAENSPLPDNDLVALALDQDGVLWVASAEAGVARLAAGDWLEPIIHAEELPSPVVHALAADGAGHMWVATGAGLARWDGRIWRRFYPPDSPLPAANVTALLAASDGVLWAGTPDGVAALDGSWDTVNFRDRTTPSGLDDTFVTSLWSDGDTLWAGRVTGVSLSSDGGRTWENIDDDDGLGYYVQSVWGQDGRVWAATEEGVSRSDDGGRTWVRFTTEDGLISDDVRAVWSDGASIWAGTDRGVSRSDDDGATWRASTDDQGLSSPFVRALWGDGAVLWAGTTRGLSRSDDRGESWRSFTREDGLASNNIRALWGQGETLFVATEAGISRTDDRGATWTTATEDDGLPSRNVISIWGDGRSVWAGTRGAGVARSDDGGVTWQLLGPTDYLPSTNIWAIWHDGSTLWLATGGGLARYRPQGPVPWARLEPLRGRNLTYGPTGGQGERNPQPRPEDASPRPGDTMKLLDSDRLTVQFVGGSLLFPPESLRFDYDLVGWTQAAGMAAPGRGIGVTQEFAGLAFGDYIFTLDVVDGDGKRSPPMAWPVTVQAAPQVTVEQVTVNGSRTVNLGRRPAGPTIYDIFAGHGTLWLATGRGVSRSDDGGATWRTFTAAANGLGTDTVLAVAANGDGIIWAGTDGAGVSRSSDGGRTWQSATDITGLGGNRVNDLWPGPDGTLWAATSGGLSRSMDGGATWQTAGAQSGLPAESVLAVTGMGDRIWIGLESGALAALETGASTWQLYPPEATYAGLPVVDLWGDGGRVWAATSGGGLVRLDVEDGRRLVYGVDQGLPDPDVRSIWGDGARLWAGTATGLAVSDDAGAGWRRLDTTQPVVSPLVSPTPNLAPDLAEVSRVRGGAGLLWVGTLGRSLFYTADQGATWGVTPARDELFVENRTWRNGLALAVSTTITDADSPPESVGVDYLLRLPDGTETGLLPDEDGNLTVQAGSWGQYALLVRATDGDGNPSPPLSVPLHLQEPFWQTFFNVIALSTMAAMLLIFLLIGYPAAVYAFVARPHNLPLTVALDPRRLNRILRGGRQGYSQFVVAVSDQPPLGELLVLTLPTRLPFDLEAVRANLQEQGVPVGVQDLQAALDGLVRREILTQQEGTYRFPVPDLPRIYARAVGAGRVDALMRQVRDENPLYTDAVRFLRAAGFELTELRSSQFLLRAKSARMRERFGDIFAEVALDKALQARDIRAIQWKARNSYQGQVDGRLALVVVDRPPEADARFQIYAYRAESNLTIIPISHALLRQALLDGRAAEVLDSQIRLYLGETDLYAVSTPITDVLSFFGRARIIEDILTRFDQGQHVGLFGLRKMGKTSLVWQLRERMRRGVVAFVDLQASGRDAGLLYGQIVQEWVRDLRFKYPDLILPRLQTVTGEDGSRRSDDMDGRAVEAFRQDVAALLGVLDQRVGEPRLVLFLDEVERMLPAPGEESGGFTDFEAFLSVLRGLAQSRRRLTLLVASVDPRLNRTDRWGAVDNPMYRFFQEIFLAPFDAGECAEMVTNIGQQMGIRYTDEALDLIYAEGGGHPFLTRDLCSVIIADLARPATVDMAQVQSGLEQYLLQPSSYLDSLWEDRLDDQEQHLIMHLAEQEPVTRAALLATFNAGADAPSPDARRHLLQMLGNLTERHMLHSDAQGYRLNFHLLSRWVCYQLLGYDLDELPAQPRRHDDADAGATDPDQSSAGG